MKSLKRRCITLIESLIAIIVVWLGIIVILEVVISNIWLVDRLRNKTIWTFLAKEWMELLISYRDSNLQRWINWNCLELDSNFNCIKRFWDIDYLQIALNWSWWEDMFLNGWDSIYYVKSTNWNFEDNILYFHTWVVNWKIIWYYNYDFLDWKKTRFARFLHFTGVYLQWDSTVVSKDKVLKIESIVLWRHWWKTGKVILETLLWDIK